MKVGVPTEIKPDEYRVSLTPAGRARAGRARPRGADPGRRRRRAAAIADADYEAQGARILPDAEAVFGEAEMVLGVKEPQPRGGRAAAARPPLFTYLHLAPDPELTRGAGASPAPPASPTRPSRTRAGRLPLLAPMSEVAGKIATQAGAFMLEKPLGGRGVLLGGVPGVAAANVLVIGGGVVGFNAAVDRDRHGGRRVRLRPQRRPPARAGHRLRRARLHRLLVHARDRGDAAARRPRDRRGAGARRQGAVRDHARAARADEAATPCWWTCRSTRAAASRPRGPPPTPTPPSRSTASPTTAWRTCPARCRSPRPTR